MHTLQTIVANFEPLDDFHLNLHELDILNLLTNISMTNSNYNTNKCWKYFELETAISCKKKKCFAAQTFQKICLIEFYSTEEDYSTKQGEMRN